MGRRGMTLEMYMDESDAELGFQVPFAGSSDPHAYVNITNAYLSPLYLARSSFPRFCCHS